MARPNLAIVFFSVLAGVAALAVLYFAAGVISPANIMRGAQTSIASVPETGGMHSTFICDGGKSITAVFYDTPSSYVILYLPDGRQLTVPQALSADGARYANPDGSFLFWNTGDASFVQENGVRTYTDCVTNG